MEKGNSSDNQYTSRSSLAFWDLLHLDLHQPSEDGARVTCYVTNPHSQASNVSLKNDLQCHQSLVLDDRKPTIFFCNTVIL